MAQYVFLSVFFCLSLSASNGLSFPNWVAAPTQPVSSAYFRNFDYNHDKGFYLNLAFGPEWNHSIQNPSLMGLRFGTLISIGGIVSPNWALHGSFWMNFHEKAAIFAMGPGFTYLFNSNFAVGLQIGLAKALNLISQDNEAFNETVLASQLHFGKYWWLGPSSSVGLLCVVGLHGFSLGQMQISNLGWNAGLMLSFLFN